jgi:transposase
MTSIIPSRSDQPENPDFDRETYRRRNLIERLVGQLKQFRRAATRYVRAAERIEARPTLPRFRPDRLHRALVTHIGDTA